jgi:hypothetical protein
MSSADSAVDLNGRAPDMHTPSPLDAVVHDAGRKLLNLRLTRIAGNYADADDAKNLNQDLDAICDIIDPVILAIGEYAKEHFSGISQKDIELFFTDQLKGAIEGNADFTITSAASEQHEQMMDDAFLGR